MNSYRDDAWSWPIVQALESNFPAIEKEVLAAYDSGGLHSHATFDSVTSLVTKGYWGEIDIIARFKGGVSSIYRECEGSLAFDRV